MIRVFIADGHPIVRKGLASALRDAADIQVVGEATDGKELVSQLVASTDVLLLELALPGRPGLELVEELRGRYPRLAVLIFTIHDEAAYVVRAAQAGAAGYLTKSTPTVELVGAIRQVAAGRKYFTGEIAEKLAYHLESHHPDNRHETLSAREMQVLVMLAAGKTIKDIGFELAVSPKTVTTYRMRVLEKLGLATNADLIRYAIQHGLGATGLAVLVRAELMSPARIYPTAPVGQSQPVPLQSSGQVKPSGPGPRPERNRGSYRVADGE